MSQAPSLIRGEFRRVYDDRYRISLPPECVASVSGDCVLAKERDGCLSLWNADLWKQKIDRGLELIEHKLQLDYLDRDLVKLQRFSRLLSTRSRPIRLAPRGRLLVPEGFREFLAVEPNSEVIIIGAGICLEIWNPQQWLSYVREDVAHFHDLMKELTT